MAVIRFFPLWRSAEKDADKGFLGQIINLCPAPKFFVFIKSGREIGGFLGQDEQLRMPVEQGDEQSCA
jgi:hypothetical protein